MLNDLARHKLIAILRNVVEESVGHQIDVLHRAGVRYLEVTFRPQWTLRENADFLRRINVSRWPGMTLGAGTILSPDAVYAAQDGGAEFILSPNCDPAVITTARNIGLFSVPGAMTPTEVKVATDSGADLIKIFPAGLLGSTYIRDLLAPFPNTPICAVGGVNLENAREYLDAGAVCVGIGSALQSSIDTRVQFEALESSIRSLRLLPPREVSASK